MTALLDVFGGILLALILFGMSHVLWVSLVLMVFVGFGMIQCASVSNTIIQTLVPEDKRGRVMSYYTVAFVGMAPFGSLLAGSMAHIIGAPRTVLVTGSCCVAGAAWFWTKMKVLRAAMRPIYQQLGIIPAPATQLVVENAGTGQ